MLLYLSANFSRLRMWRWRDCFVLLLIYARPTLYGHEKVHTYSEITDEGRKRRTEYRKYRFSLKEFWKHSRHRQRWLGFSSFDNPTSRMSDGERSSVVENRSKPPVISLVVESTSRRRNIRSGREYFQWATSSDVHASLTVVTSETWGEKKDFDLCNSHS